MNVSQPEFYQLFNNLTQIAESKLYTVYCDGSPEKLCVLVDGEPHIKDWRAEGPDPLQIEYMALYYAVDELPEGASAVIYCDNQIVVAQMNSDYEDYFTMPSQRIANDLVEAKGLHIRVKWVPREMNEAGQLL